MALVHLRNDSIWFTTRRVLHELLGLMTDELLPDDGEALYKVVQAEAFGALQLHRYQPDVAERLERVLLRVVHAVIDGRLPKQQSEYLQTQGSYPHFVGSMRELLKVMMVPVQGGGGAPAR